MSDVLNRVAIADVTGTLTTDFDLPTLLQTVATHARGGFDAYSAVIVLRDDRRSTAGDDLHIVAESCQAGVGADTQLNTTGPALNSAHDGAVTLVTDLATIEDTRWPGYRQRALSTGTRSRRCRSRSARWSSTPSSPGTDPASPVSSGRSWPIWWRSR